MTAKRGRPSPRPDPGPVFSALADDTRRAVFEAVSDGSATATELARSLPVSRQAISKHLQQLADAGLVETERHGREQRYRPTAAPFADAQTWMVDVGRRWDTRLDRLEARIAERANGDGSAP